MSRWLSPLSGDRHDDAGADRLLLNSCSSAMTRLLNWG
jgi:hypothetical protein